MVRYDDNQKQKPQREEDVEIGQRRYNLYFIGVVIGGQLEMKSSDAVAIEELVQTPYDSHSPLVDGANVLVHLLLGQVHN